MPTVHLPCTQRTARVHVRGELQAIPWRTIRDPRVLRQPSDRVLVPCTRAGRRPSSPVPGMCTGRRWRHHAHSMRAPAAWQARTQLVEAAELVRRRRQHAPPERDVLRRLDVRARHCAGARLSTPRRAVVDELRAQHVAGRRMGRRQDELFAAKLASPAFSLRLGGRAWAVVWVL